MKFVCVNCSRKKDRKVMFETDKYIEKTVTMRRKKKIEGKRRKVKGKAFKRRVAIGTCPVCGVKCWKFIKKK